MDDARAIRSATLLSVHVVVRLFAMLRERAGASTLELELPEGACVRDALREVGELAAGLPLVMAVNRSYAAPDAPLAEGDELALIPPVSGGQNAAPSPAVSATLLSEPLSVDRLLFEVRDPRAGAVVSFQGVTRTVERLEYEAYEEMARERLFAIGARAREAHGLCRVALSHRIGAVPLSEPSVVVAVSAPHRAEAFAGAREIIDAIKAQAPIWKREVDGKERRWVPGNAPTP